MELHCTGPVELLLDDNKLWRTDDGQQLSCIFDVRRYTIFVKPTKLDSIKHFTVHTPALRSIVLKDGAVLRMSGQFPRLDSIVVENGASLWFMKGNFGTIMRLSIIAINAKVNLSDLSVNAVVAMASAQGNITGLTFRERGQLVATAGGYISAYCDKAAKVEINVNGGSVVCHDNFNPGTSTVVIG